MFRRSAVAAVVRVSAGNLLEMYDFTVFGYYAAAIGRTFFPAQSEFASLMSSFATFGVGFLMRPLGALVLGAYVDRKGRRDGLMLTLGLMSIGTLAVACTPGYASIGLLAPLIVVLGRLVQGFSAGVELGGVSVYLAEIATPGNRGFFVSWQSASQQISVVLAALFGVLLNGALSKAQMDAWGWRVPLIAGCAILPYLFLLRRSLAETGDFLERERHPSTGEILASLAANWRVVTLGSMLVMMTTVSFYTITAYTPTFGTRVLHLGSRDALLITLCVGVSNFVWLPLSGALSDRIGRTRPLVFFTLLALATAWPALQWLASHPSFGHLLAVELWLSFLYGAYNGAMQVHLAEIMPREVRASGFSIAYSLAAAIFGGFTPAIATWLIEATKNPAMPGVWLSFAAAASLIAALLTRNPHFARSAGASTSTSLPSGN